MSDVNCVRIVIDNGQQHVLDLFPQRLINPADHAKVKQSDHIARQQQQIPGMRIGVEIPVAEHRFQIELGPTTRDLLAVEAHFVHPRLVA